MLENLDAGGLLCWWMWMLLPYIAIEDFIVIEPIALPQQRLLHATQKQKPEIYIAISSVKQMVMQAMMIRDEQQRFNPVYSIFHYSA